MTPDKIGLKYEEHQLATPDGHQLNTWLLLPDTPSQAQTIVFAYGDAGNMSYSLAYAHPLVQRGYTVVLIDYRGFGHSSDFAYDANQYYYNEYATDLCTTLRWTKEQRPDHKTAVWAFSMGTLMATLAYEREEFDALIAEGLVWSPVKCRERIKELKGKELKLPEGAAEAPEQLEKMTIPMLLVAGKEDQITSLSDSQAAAEGKSNRRVLEHDGQHLRGVLSLGMDVYLEAIERLLLLQ